MNNTGIFSGSLLYMHAIFCILCMYKSFNGGIKLLIDSFFIGRQLDKCYDNSEKTLYLCIVETALGYLLMVTGCGT